MSLQNVNATLQRECNTRKTEEACLREYIADRESEIWKLSIFVTRIPPLTVQPNDNEPSFQDNCLTEKYETAIQKVKSLESEVSELKIRDKQNYDATANLLVTKEEKIAELQAKIRYLDRKMELSRMATSGANGTATKLSNLLNHVKGELEKEKEKTLLQDITIQCLCCTNDEMYAEKCLKQQRIDRYEAIIKEAQKYPPPSKMVMDMKNRPRRPMRMDPDFEYGHIPGHSQSVPVSTSVAAPTADVSHHQSKPQPPSTQAIITASTARVPPQLTSAQAPSLPTIAAAPFPPVHQKLTIAMSSSELKRLGVSSMGTTDVAIEHPTQHKVPNPPLNNFKVWETSATSLMEPTALARLQEHVATYDMGYNYITMHYHNLLISHICLPEHRLQ